MNKPSDNLFQRRIVRSLSHSMDGFKAALFTEEAFRVEALLFCVLAPLGLYLGKDPISRLLLVGSLVLVLIVELLNTGIEAAVDRVSMDWHEQAKRAKDMGSAAVLLSMLLVVLTWGVVLLG
jgi:diacylglycerol kinase (ATP)